MGRPKKIVEQSQDESELDPVEAPVVVKPAAEVLAIGADGKVPVMKGGVTRRIYPGQLAAWRAEGWV